MAYHNTKQFNHELYQSIKTRNYAEAEKLIYIGFNEMTFKFKDRRGFMSLVLNYNMDQKNDDEIDKILTNNFDIIMKRDLLNCSKYYYQKNIDKSIEIFKKLIDNFYFDNSCLDFIISNNMLKFLIFLDGKYLNTNLDGNFISDYSILKKYNFDQQIIKQAKNKLKKNLNLQIIKNVYMKISENNLNVENIIIIDAGNILFSKSGKLSASGYSNLIDSVVKLLSIGMVPILVIHSRHLKLKFKGENKSKKIIEYINTIKMLDCIIVETPYNVNDDFYIVYLALQFECNIITNDNYKDHIFNFRSNDKSNMENMIENYIESKLVKYNFSSKKICFDKINNYSKCIQIIDNKCYIPKNNKFISLTI